MIIKTQRLVCDRCDREIQWEGDQFTHSHISLTENRASMAPNGDTGGALRAAKFDLCSQCSAAFNKWMAARPGVSDD